MKKWNAAEIVELNINETAQNILGNEYDNGYIGDGHLGLLQWSNSNDNNDDSNKNDETGKLS